MKTIKGFEGEKLEVSDFGKWVGNDFIDYKFEYENNQKIIKILQQENQQLKNQLKIKHNGFMASVDESCDLAKENQKYKEVIDKAIEWIKKRINSCTIEAESTTNDTMCKITISGLYNLLNILEEVE